MKTLRLALLHIKLRIAEFEHKRYHEEYVELDNLVMKGKADAETCARFMTVAALCDVFHAKRDKTQEAIDEIRQ